MFENFKKEWKIYKFIKQNRDKLKETSDYWHWNIGDDIQISVFDDSIFIQFSKSDCIRIDSALIVFMIRIIIQEKREQIIREDNKRQKEKESEQKDKFLKDNNIQ